jgi:hypothetical protein
MLFEYNFNFLEDVLLFRTDFDSWIVNKMHLSAIENSRQPRLL